MSFMLFGQLVATFVICLLSSVTIARTAGGQDVPPGNFIWVSVAVTFLLWSFGVFG